LNGPTLPLDELEQAIETDEEYEYLHSEFNPTQDLISRLYILAVIYGVFIILYSIGWYIKKNYGPFNCLSMAKETENPK